MKHSPVGSACIDCNLEAGVRVFKIEGVPTPLHPDCYTKRIVTKVRTFMTRAQSLLSREKWGEKIAALFSRIERCPDCVHMAALRSLVIDFAVEVKRRFAEIKIELGARLNEFSEGFREVCGAVELEYPLENAA